MYSIITSITKVVAIRVLVTYNLLNAQSAKVLLVSFLPCREVYSISEMLFMLVI